MFSVQEEDFEREVKVVVVGNGCVGKTSMIRQFCKGVYTKEYKKTIGVDFLEKIQFVKGLDEEVKLMLWDTAGQEQFHSMTRAYYRGARAAALCFSTIDRASFEAIRSWKEKVEDECGEIPMVLVQNKVDLLENAAVSRQEAEDLATELGLRFYRICVKENLHVADVFEYLAELYLRRDLRLCYPTSTPRPNMNKALASKVAIAQAPQVGLKMDTPARDPRFLTLGGGGDATSCYPNAPFCDRVCNFYVLSSWPDQPVLDFTYDRCWTLIRVPIVYLQNDKQVNLAWKCLHGCSGTDSTSKYNCKKFGWQTSCLLRNENIPSMQSWVF